MKAAIVRGPGQVPVYGEFDWPEPRTGEGHVRVSAAALSHVTRSRASGAHYSSSGAFPFIPGIDGVGRLGNGKRVYFILPRAPFGAMAQNTVAEHCLSLPDSIDDITAAAIANPGMSSWAALTERAKLKRGETVLINGATGIAGRLAVQIAKHLGAGKVIAIGRNEAALREVEALGADATIALTEDGAALEDALKRVFADGVDVVLDYLWGPSAERVLVAAAKAAPEARAVRFVQVGSASGVEITLPSAVLRSSAIEMMGSGIGSVPPKQMLAAIAAVLTTAARKKWRVATHVLPLSAVESAWNADLPGKRTVFTI